MALLGISHGCYHYAMLYWYTVSSQWKRKQPHKPLHRLILAFLPTDSGTLKSVSFNKLFPMAWYAKERETAARNVSYISRPTGAPTPLGYSHVTISEPGLQWVEISGQVGKLEDDTILGSYKEQVFQACKNLKISMDAAHVRACDLLKIRFYSVGFDAEKMEVLKQAMGQVISPEYLSNLPGSLLVCVPSLADPRYHFEMEATAVRRPNPAMNSLPPTVPDVMDTDVVVVGAGLSGLQAAVDLQAAGFRVLVVEATDRVGGRTFSVESSPGGSGKVDLGGAWINDTYQSRIWALAKKYNIDTEKQSTQGHNLKVNADGSVDVYPFDQLTVRIPLY